MGTWGEILDELNRTSTPGNNNIPQAPVKKQLGQTSGMRHEARPLYDQREP